MAHSRRIIMPVKDIAAEAAAAHERVSPGTSTKNDVTKTQVSFAAQPPNQDIMADSSTGDRSESSIAPAPQHRSRAINYVQTVLSGNDQHLAPATMRSLSNVERVSGRADEVININDGVDKGNAAIEMLSRSTDNADGGLNTITGPANTTSLYDGQSDSDHDDIEVNAKEVEGGDVQLRERKPKLSEQEWRSMAKFAQAQGIDLMKQVEEQKRLRLAQEQEAPNIAKNEMDEMKRILQEKRRSSEEYLVVPTESDRESSPERIRSRRRRHPHHYHHHHSIDSERDVSPDRVSRRDSANSEINDDLKIMFNIEDPSKVLDWLRGDAETDKGIVLSEDRTISLLQAIREGALTRLTANEGALTRLTANEGGFRDALTSSQEDLVPMERLREAERRSSVAEEQVRYFEQLFNGEGGSEGVGDEQLRAVLSKSKTIDRHFAHLKKFAEDRQSDLRKQFVLSEKDSRTWRPNSSRSGVSPEKARKDLQEHDNHKKRLMQVFSIYNEVLSLVKVEHSKRIEAEHKCQQLTSQLKRQTATLKRAEKVIKHTALSPIMLNESQSFRGASTSDKNSMASPSPTASGRQSPVTSLSRQHSPFSLSGLQTLSNTTDQDHDGDIKRLDSARGNRMLPLKRVNTTGKSNLRAAALPSPSSTSTPNHPTITKQLTNDLALEQALSRDPSPGRIRSSTSDLIAQNHKKEFEELEKALIEEGRSRGFADVDLYSEKKTVGREETCWEYRHVHFDFTKPHQSAAPPHEGGGSSPPRSDRLETLDLNSISNVSMSRRTASPSRSEGTIIEEKHDYPWCNEEPNKTLPLVAGTHVQDEFSSKLHESVKGYHHQVQSLATPMALPRNNGEGLEKISDKHVEIVEQRAADEEITMSSANQQTETFRSFPAGLAQSTPVVKIGDLVDSSENNSPESAEAVGGARRDVDREINGGKLRNEITSTQRLFETMHAGDEMELVMESRADVAEDSSGDDVAKDEVPTDVAKEEVWDDASQDERADLAEVIGYQKERRADRAAASRAMADVAIQKKEKPHGRRHHPAAKEAAISAGQSLAAPEPRHINRKEDARPPQRETSDLQRRLAAIEASQLVHFLHGQVKRRCRLLLIQIVFFAAALVWGVFPASWRSASPPT